MTARDELAEYLLACRKQAKLTQETAGGALNVDASQISRWETRKQLPKSSRSRDLAEAYGVDPAEMSLKIAAAWEEDAAQSNQALALVASLIERIDDMQASLDELLRLNQGR